MSEKQNIKGHPLFERWITSLNNPLCRLPPYHSVNLTVNYSCLPGNSAWLDADCLWSWPPPFWRWKHPDQRGKKRVSNFPNDEGFLYTRCLSASQQATWDNLQLPRIRRNVERESPGKMCVTSTEEWTDPVNSVLWFIRGLCLLDWKMRWEGEREKLGHSRFSVSHPLLAVISLSL
jgi:hypothetical protein